jgi:uncharacterized protein YjbI with pentapeptide repeats
LEAALDRLAEKGILDARGCCFTGTLLKQVLQALSKEQADRPVFKGDALFDKATFAGVANFNRATFQRRASFSGAIFQREGEVSFTGATFQGEALFTNATFMSRADFTEATFQARAGFTGNTAFVRRGLFNKATFQSNAAFDGAIFGGNAEFSGAIFEQARHLGPLRVGPGSGGVRPTLILDEAIFRQRVQVNIAASRVSCCGTRFLAGMHLRVRWAQIMLDDADLAGPSILSGAPPFRGLDEREPLPDWRREPAPPLPDGGPRDGRPWLASLQGADVSGLTVTGVDLQACRFAGAHNLDQLRLGSSIAFATTPGWQAGKGLAWPPAWGWTRRQALAEEHSWRATFERGIRHAGWHSESWPERPGCSVSDPSRPHQVQEHRLWRHPSRADGDPQKTPSSLIELWRWRAVLSRLRAARALVRREEISQLIELWRWRAVLWRLRAARALVRREEISQRRECAREIANLYRALRKGYEDNRNEPGAADFYYGEMELRRKATPSSVERAILFLYWLVSGYGLRAWRALAAVLAILVPVALLLGGVGFAAPSPATAANGVAATGPAPDTSFVGAVIYGLRTAIGLPHDPQPPLTRWGDLLQIALRITVPVLLGLAVLSIRGRVKR